ncbi:hypothetical protein [Mucilaginibacter sp. L196]|uniref:hypothetical protein n=1 Tax=Mucilaginibacter sp. L196 TaxID=1641870 RepID=UPI00131EC8FE|nr:hypothetical protein [Mucilaginibacter sp. L196]
MGIVIIILFIVLFATVFPVYGYVGRRLKKNYILWGFIGWGVILSSSLVLFPFIFLFRDTDSRLTFWTAVKFTSPTVSLFVAWYIAYRNGFLKKKEQLA